MERDPSMQRDHDPLPKWTKDDRRTDMFATRRMFYVIFGLLIVMAIVAALINYWHDDMPMTHPAPQEQTVPRTP